MGEFHSEKADIVLAACQTGIEEAGAALSRAFDGEYQCTAPGEFSALNMAEMPDGFGGPGLALEVQVEEDATALMLLPAASNLLPVWCEAPNETESSLLATLAQELATVLLPEEFPADKVRANYVTNLSNLCREAQLSNPTLIRLHIKDESDEGHLSLIWPARRFGVSGEALPESGPAEAAPGGSPAEGPAVDASPPPAAQPAEAAPQSGRQTPVLQYADLEDGLRLLPTYARSLLKINLPVRVLLAQTRMPVDQVQDLGPGSILQFRKSCDETLSLEVGGLRVAEGEAVKVGDKFGLWITSIALPDERFESIERGR